MKRVCDISEIQALGMILLWEWVCVVNYQSNLGQNLERLYASCPLELFSYASLSSEQGF